jgi:branched-chain amino acid transport system substrate-binding protein
VHFINGVSTSIEAVLRPVGLEKAQGIISALFLKDPNDPQWADDQGVKDYLAFMAKYYPEGNTKDLLNVYAYTSSAMLVKVLTESGDDLSRKNVMKNAANLKDFAPPMLLPGIAFNTSPTDFRPMEQVQLARVEGERWVRFGEVIDASER